MTTYSMTKHSTMNHVHIAGRILHEVPMNVCSVSGDCEMIDRKEVVEMACLSSSGRHEQGAFRKVVFIQYVLLEYVL